MSGMRAALPWYEKAARLDPANAMSHYYLGFAYKDQHQRARAVEHFRAYLAKRPDAEDRTDIEREIDDLRAGD
jgi:cytochrome c-type biogenesis protein CcmH/NrfG